MNRGTREHRYDIAIVGGGLVGASLACALAPLGFSVGLLEAVPFRTSSQPSYDDRTLVLSHSSCRILQGIGIWDRLAGNTTPVREVIVTELGRPGRVVLKPSELDLQAFGHVVEARAFGAAVLREIERIDNIELLCPARVTAVETGPDRAILGVESDGDEIRIEAGLLVAADGAGSTIRRLLGIPARQHDYGQTAVICNVTPQESHRGRAFERLTATGPFAVLPHVGDRCGLVWCVPSPEADALLGLAEKDFLAGAQQRFGRALGSFVKMGKRSAYPLKLVRADRDVHERLVILGNAAHAIHPIGAQGFNLGLRDVAVLAEVLSGQAGGDAGMAGTLRAYSEWRRPDHDSTIAWSDGMARLFANPSPAAALVRSAGMLAHALVPGLRRRLTSSAMGYRGRVPMLALGQPLPGVPR